jgi:isovaleryl-CoA dehydrogenase
VTTPLDALERVVEEIVAPNAGVVDRAGTFPHAAMAALRAEGFLGLTSSAEVGGAGLGMAEAATVIERLASACGSTAMVTLMHYAATSVVEAHGDESLRREIASGDHLTTLAFSEQGSRSHFWAPMGTATSVGESVALDASKSWVTSAAQADSYVWSSRPLAGDGPMTLWSVRADTDGLTLGDEFDGLGLRGNGSVPVLAAGALVPASARLGADGAGLDIALATALPWFLVLSTAFALGVMEAVTAETGRHIMATRLDIWVSRSCTNRSRGSTTRRCACGPTPCARSSATRSARSARGARTRRCGSSSARRWPPRPRSTSPTSP